MSPAARKKPASTAQARRAELQRVLAIRLDPMSDVLGTTPALAAIAECVAGVEITLLTSTSAAPLAPHLAMVGDTIAYDAPWSRSERPSDAAADLRLVKTLEDRRFDMALVFTAASQSSLPAAMLARLAGIPRRVAYCRENPHDLLTTWLGDPDAGTDGAPPRGDIQRQLDLVAALGWQPAERRLRFALAYDDIAGMSLRLQSAGLAPESRWVVVHVGETASARTGPPARFGAAAETIAQDSACTVVFAGLSGEASWTTQVRAAMQQPSVSLAGKLGIGELGALISGAALLIACDIGMLRLAAAVGTPAIDVNRTPPDALAATALALMSHPGGMHDLATGPTPTFLS